MKSMILAGLAAASALAAVAPAAQAQERTFGYYRSYHHRGYFGPNYVVAPPPPVFYRRGYYGPPVIYGPRWFHRYHCFFRYGYRVCRR